MGFITRVLKCLGLGMYLLFSASAEAQEDKPAPPNLFVDSLGDPLPAGVRARLGTVRFRHGLFMHALAYSPDGKLLATAGRDALRVWDADTGKERYSLPAPAKADNGIHGYLAVSFAPNGKILAAGACDGTIGFWEPATGEQQIIWAAHPGQIPKLAFSPDSKVLTSVGREGMMRFWSVPRGGLIRSVGEAGQHDVRCALSPDGSTAAVGYQGVRVYETMSGKQILDLAPSLWVRALMFPDDKTLAVGGKDVRFWDIATGKEKDALRIDTAGINVSALALSADQKTLAVAGYAIAKNIPCMIGSRQKKSAQAQR